MPTKEESICTHKEAVPDADESVSPLLRCDNIRTHGIAIARLTRLL